MSHAIMLLPRNDWDWTCWTQPWRLPSCRGAVDRSDATVGFAGLFTEITLLFIV